MYAYIDESGNTGSNLFDPAQPYFLTVAMSSAMDFDDVFRSRVERMANRIGTDHLHASAIGVDGVEAVAAGLIELVEFSQTRFYFAAVNKRDVAALKFFDAIFDAGENRAASRYGYALSPLRFHLVKDFVGLLDVTDTRLFWNAMTRVRSPQTVQDAVSAIDNVLERLGTLNDPRSRDLIGDTMRWARDNIDEFSFWTSRKEDHYGQLPNLFTLPRLLNSISDAAKHWDCKVDRIVHDQQSQFGRTLQEWHSSFAGHDRDLIFDFGDTPIRLANIHGSHFEMRDSKASPGLQVVDLVLWTFSRSLSGKFLGRHSTALFELCFSPDNVYFMSLGSILEELERMHSIVMDLPLTEDQILEGMALLRDVEQRRQEWAGTNLD